MLVWGNIHPYMIYAMLALCVLSTTWSNDAFSPCPCLVSLASDCECVYCYLLLFLHDFYRPRWISQIERIINLITKYHNIVITVIPHSLAFGGRKVLKATWQPPWKIKLCSSQVKTIGYSTQKCANSVVKIFA